MNGRCDNDPLDPADNVCDLCGGDFCEACLITPKGRKKPWCKKCALDRSGVRGGVKTQKKSSKREARSRRKELNETRDQREDGRFVFFDEPESDFEVRDLGEPEVEEPSESRRRKVSLGIRKNKAENSDDATEKQPVAEETPYVASDAPAPPQADDRASSAPAPAVPPPTAADAIAPEPSSTELLARLQDHLPESVAHGTESTAGLTSTSMPSLDTKFDPTFDPFAMPAEQSDQGEDPEAFDSFDADDGFELPATESYDAEPPSFDFEDSSPPPPTASQTESFPTEQVSDEPASQPQPASLLDRLAGEHATAVSRVAPVSEADFLATETSDFPASDSPASDFPASDFPASDDARDSYPVDEFLDDAPEETAFDEMPPSGGKGEDTDEDGNWIPPALRGMAPVEVRETLSLPKRGRS